jgi:hypothetical protein
MQKKRDEEIKKREAHHKEMEDLISDVKKSHKDELAKEKTNAHAGFDYAFKS